MNYLLSEDVKLVNSLAAIARGEREVKRKCTLSDVTFIL